MSDTTGWEEVHTNLHHLIDIDNKRVWIAQRVSAMWGLYLFGLPIATINPPEVQE